MTRVELLETDQANRSSIEKTSDHHRVRWPFESISKCTACTCEDDWKREYGLVGLLVLATHSLPRPDSTGSATVDVAPAAPYAYKSQHLNHWEHFQDVHRMAVRITKLPTLGVPAHVDGYPVDKENSRPDPAGPHLPSSATTSAGRPQMSSLNVLGCRFSSDPRPRSFSI